MASTRKPLPDYSAVLEVHPDATHTEMKAAYRRLAQMHRPDKNNGSEASIQMTQRINAAWAVLGSEDSKAYDLKRRPPKPKVQPTYASPAASPNPMTHFEIHIIAPIQCFHRTPALALETEAHMPELGTHLG